MLHSTTTGSWTDADRGDPIKDPAGGPPSLGLLPGSCSDAVVSCTLNVTGDGLFLPTPLSGIYDPTGCQNGHAAFTRRSQSSSDLVYFLDFIHRIPAGWYFMYYVEGTGALNPLARMSQLSQLTYWSARQPYWNNSFLGPADGVVRRGAVWHICGALQNASSPINACGNFPWVCPFPRVLLLDSPFSITPVAYL